MKTPAFLAALLALAFLPARADAQQMKLQIDNGRVTLEAQNVPVRQILAEWARVGGAKIVNGDKVVGAPLTIQLQGVPERQALDIILRNVSGYMLAARQEGTTGVSAFDRILILATSSAPHASNPGAPGGFGGAASRRMPSAPVMVEPTPVPTEDVVVEEDGDNDEPEPDAENEGEGEATGAAVQQPQGPGRFMRNNNVFPNPMGAQVQPFMPVAPQPQQGEDQQGGEQPTAVTPFGVPAGSSTTPGVVTPVPQPRPGQPTPRRPPS